MGKISDYTVTDVSKPSPAIVNDDYVRSTEDYSDILNEYNLTFKKAEYYFQVGEIKWTQGWIITISVIPAQLKDLLRAIIPLLLLENVTFRIPRNAEKARSLANGEYGPKFLGKLVVIYPDKGQELEIARELIQLTHFFKGPKILTDRKLDAVVYVRYGQGNPVININDKGNTEKFIYDTKGELIQDPVSIPFTLPEGVDWPFGPIASPKEPKLETVLQDKYKPIKILKDDFKGTVRKGLLLEKWLRIKWCVIKEGRQNMVSDAKGRDIIDRLRWQYELQKDLEGIVPIPKVYDLFSENGDGYIIMEYVKGAALDDIIAETFNGKPWVELSIPNRLRLLDFAGQILSIVEKVHAKGYIHRDITPTNFLVTKNDRLCMIDMELSYSTKLAKPYPPFRLGTPGFMSPEQEDSKRPTEQQDIYAIGALLIYTLSGLTPVKFALRYPGTLEAQLNFFISDNDLVEIICNCLDDDPEKRPSIASIRSRLEHFQLKQTNAAGRDSQKPGLERPSQKVMKEIIGSAIGGLASPAMQSDQDLWVSKKYEQDELAPLQITSVSIYPGFYQGLSGVLYLLGRAQQMGFPVQDCMESYQKSLAYFHRYCLNKLETVPAGLYFGTAGIAMALIEGLESGLIPDRNKTIEEIKLYLNRKDILGLGMATGLAGQGMVLLKAASVTGDTFTEPILINSIEQLLQFQEKDGSWITAVEGGNKPLKLTGFGYGVAGIACFLLEYLKKSRDKEEVIVTAITRSLAWLNNLAVNKPDRLLWPLNNRTRQFSADFQDGCAGIILAMIKAYEVFGNQQYRKIAEACLRKYPSYSIHDDITLAAGLTGFAEVCLEAARVFNSQEWQDQADWVTQFLLHHYQQMENGACFWLVDKSQTSMADLMTGNSGIIHFLLRNFQPGRLSHPLLIV